MSPDHRAGIDQTIPDPRELTLEVVNDLGEGLATDINTPRSARKQRNERSWEMDMGRRAENRLDARLESRISQALRPQRTRWAGDCWQ